MEERRTTSGTKPQGGNSQGRADNARTDQQPPAQGSSHDAHDAADQLYNKAKDASRYVADRASEIWDEAYDEGRRYYREGSRAVGDLDGSTVATALVAAALGYALAYLIHRQSSSPRAGVPDYARMRAEDARYYRRARPIPG